VSSPLKAYNGDQGDEESLIRYDQMDVSKPPRLIKLEICPNCRMPGRVMKGAKSVTYVHTAWKRKRDEQPRHYCKLTNDGLSMDVVIPILRAKEAP
jgi:hypothetical protein